MLRAPAASGSQCVTIRRTRLIRGLAGNTLVYGPRQLFKPRGHLAVTPLAQYEPDALQILLSAVGLFVETDDLVKKFKIIGLPRRFHIDHYETANEARLSRQLRGCHELEFFH